jgi:hypothetical protein
VSVTPTPERSLFGRIGLAIGRHVPVKAELFNRFFSIPSGERLGDLLAVAGFRDVQVQSESREIAFASFDDYFRGTEEGAGLSAGRSMSACLRNCAGSCARRFGRLSLSQVLASLW